MKLIDIITKQGVTLAATIDTPEGIDVGRVVVRWADLDEQTQQAITKAAQAEVEKE